MKHKNFLLFIAIMLAYFPQGQISFGQCMIYELPFGERFRQSQRVIEGVITEQTVFQNTTNAMIFTAYRVVVRADYKNSDDSSRQFDLIVEGGTLGNDAVTVSYAPVLAVGVNAFFFVTDSPDATHFTGELAKRFGLYGASQGVLIINNKEARDAFKHYQIDELRKLLADLAGERPIEYYPPDAAPAASRIDKSEKTLVAVVTSMNPMIITGGTFSVLTIYGSGFGNSYTGGARVAFPNANDGGATTINAPANHIISWSNTQIQTLVPSGAGTGNVRVTGVDGSQGVSSQILTIYYSLIDAVTGGVYTPSYLASAGGSYAFQFSASFFNNQPATNAFRRALATWRCATFVNFSTAYAPTSASCYNGTDGICVVAFANAGCSTPAGILAATYNFWTTCNGSNWHIREFDMMVADPAPYGGWNFGPNATTRNKFDLESVMLHELGHAGQLGHIINASKVMHWSLGANTDRRILGQEDIDGGSDVVSRSSQTRPCSPSPMTPLNATNCQLPFAPEADFSASPIFGCAPLTVQFSDLSSNAPTSWQWDINNDGSNDYFIKNPSHTFNAPGTYTIRLTAGNIAGSSALSKTNYITVYPKPKANAGKNFSACYGESAQIGGTPAASDGTPGYLYSWSGTGAPFLNATNTPNPTITLNFAGSVSCILTVTDANSCSTNDTIVISARPQLFVNAGTDKQICYGGNALLGATPTVSGGQPPFLYSWRPGATLSDSAGASPTASPDKTTDYILTVRDANNCIKRDTVRVTVFPSPKIDAGRDADVCVGTTKLLGGSPTVLGGSPPFQYSWQPASGLSSTVIANPLATPATTTRYTLTVTDANNCQWVDTVQLTTLPSPTVTIKASKSPTMCAGDTLMLDAGPGYASYLWSTGATTQKINIWEAGTYSVQVANANHCSAYAVNPVNVTLNPRPNSIINGPKSICAGNSASYTTIPEYNANYEWSVSGGIIQSGQGQSQVSVKWTGTNGSIQLRKTFSSSGCSSTNSIAVTIGSAIKPALVAPKTFGCEGDSLSIAAAGGYASYKWSNGATSRSIIVGKSGVYSVVAVDNDGCAATSDPITITIYPLPARPYINRRGDTLFSTYATAYQWRHEDALLSGETRQFLPVRQLGNYSVTIWDAYNCSAQSSAYTIGSLSGITENNPTSKIKVFPNPFDDAGFTIDFGGLAAEYEVFSAAGITVAQGNLKGEPTVVSLENFPAGAYLIKTRRGAEFQFEAVIKSR